MGILKGRFQPKKISEKKRVVVKNHQILKNLKVS